MEGEAGEKSGFERLAERAPIQDIEQRSESEPAEEAEAGLRKAES